MDVQNNVTRIEQCSVVPTEEEGFPLIADPATASQVSTTTTSTTTTAKRNTENINSSDVSEEKHNDHRRESRNRKKRQRKRPRSEWLMNEIGETTNSDTEPKDSGVIIARLDIMQLAGNNRNENIDESANIAVSSVTSSDSSPFLRIVYPYPHTFTSFCKARWIGRSILDVYCTEFGSYPSSYYKIAVQQGRIRVSDRIVPVDYVLQAKDVLLHTVHRHEPGVVVQCNKAPYVRIVEETTDLIAIDKPSTLPVHPCGGYYRNSLMNLLNETFKQQKFYTIHRLDRLTSGLIVIAKNTNVAKEWGQAIQSRDQNCQKIYLARVKGHFGRNISKMSLPKLQCNDSTTGVPQYGEFDNTYEDDSLSEAQTRRKKYAYGYWMTDAITGDTFPNDDNFLQMNQFALIEHSIDEWLERAINVNTIKPTDDLHVGAECQPFIWFNMACPVCIEQPKIGICAAGKFEDIDDAIFVQTVKPAHTRFGIVKFDSVTDSTVVIIQPFTGRTHQIRIHLQHVQHSIANDPNYGGQLWYGNPDGQRSCVEAQQILDQCKDSNSTIGLAVNDIIDAADDGGLGTTKRLNITDVPATDEEIQNSVQCTNSLRNKSESITDWIQRTCVWCNRLYDASDMSKVLNGGNIDLNKVVEQRAKLEFLVRSPGLWLHAFQYKVNDKTFRTEIPDWCQI